MPPPSSRRRVPPRVVRRRRVFFYGGTPFLARCRSGSRDRVPGMMALISLAISVAFVFSIAVTLGIPGMSLWDELLDARRHHVARTLDRMRSISQAQGALQELAKLLPSEAPTRVRWTGRTRAPLRAQRRRHGARVAGECDRRRWRGRQGASAVNESMLTGESRAVGKTEGDKVIAGTINGNGSLRVEVTGTGDRTTLASITQLVAQAQSSRSRAQALADRAAFALTLIAVGSAIATLSCGSRLAQPPPTPSSASSRCS